MIGFRETLRGLFAGAVERAGLGIHIHAAGEHKAAGACDARGLQCVHVAQHIDGGSGNGFVVGFVNVGNGGKIIDDGCSLGGFDGLIQVHDVANDHFLIALQIGRRAAIK